jgi:hypothetical protein
VSRPAVVVCDHSHPQLRFISGFTDSKWKNSNLKPELWIRIAKNPTCRKNAAQKPETAMVQIRVTLFAAIRKPPSLSWGLKALKGQDNYYLISGKIDSCPETSN